MPQTLNGNMKLYGAANLRGQIVSLSGLHRGFPVYRNPSGPLRNALKRRLSHIASRPRRDSSLQVCMLVKLHQFYDIRRRSTLGLRFPKRPG
jgi:hypothetical protein